MFQTPKGLRLHIVVLGRVNVGKSSFLNLVTGQETAVTSSVAGTTTDVVEKAQELPPLGPVLWLDTAGFGDTTPLSDKRLSKTLSALKRADVALLVLEGSKQTPADLQIIDLVNKAGIPLIKVFNKADLFPVSETEEGIKVCATDLSSRENVLNRLTAHLIKLAPEEFLNPPAMLADLVPEKADVIMIVPLDYEAPKGRLILPQVQAIRECLDHNQNVYVVKENMYLSVLDNLKKQPDLVVCDSQVVKQMVEQTPLTIKCTTFSILMARLKGDLKTFVTGAQKIETLQDGDKVLIAESCTHHAADDDIGTVKIPNLMLKKTGKKLTFDKVSGCTFPKNLQEYQLVVQCGGCTQNRREMLARLQIAETNGVAITNYGVCLSALNGVLERVLEPFAEK